MLVDIALTFAHTLTAKYNSTSSAVACIYTALHNAVDRFSIYSGFCMPCVIGTIFDAGCGSCLRVRVFKNVNHCLPACLLLKGFSFFFRHAGCS